MKPITNILLIAAIVCYVFLPFRTMELTGSITGLNYSAGLITENFSLLKTIFALLPFIACFGGVALNYNKNRYWGIATAVVILAGIAFFSKPEFVFQSWTLSHDPELLGDQAAQIEGFKVKELNIGYHATHALMWLSLVSCIISIFPFKFNQTIERTIDERMERRLAKRKAAASKGKENAENTASPTSEPAKEETPQQPKTENPADYMPK
ncbi:MAG: hypothetical protein Q4B68_10845 [Bacteroidales bacterium]|nr:hypothetical protein [Bacteroidales bacterium]